MVIELIEIKIYKIAESGNTVHEGSQNLGMVGVRELQIFIRLHFHLDYSPLPSGAESNPSEAQDSYAGFSSPSHMTSVTYKIILILLFMHKLLIMFILSLWRPQFSKYFQ